MSRDYVLRPKPAVAVSSIEYAEALNPQQLAAVTALPGPALVIAGAGAGKTRTLIYRVAFLLEQGIAPERLLLLTFTNKAAREMMRRVGDLLGSDISALWGGTFHAMGNRVLRRHADLLGYPRDFTILDRDDAKELIQACLDESGIDLKAKRFPKADVLGELFSLALNTGRTLAAMIEEQFDHFETLTPEIERIRSQYAERKRASGVMDFDDLLWLWLRLLRDHESVREQYQRRFQFILVDEYQDTNRLQGELIDRLAERHRNVMVVGDDSQSIYAWRGADFQNIMRFPERYRDARMYKIEMNYRSTPQILAVANAVIAANVRQFTKVLTPTRNPGDKPARVLCGSGSEQARFVAQRVVELHDGGMPLREMAVLYRSHFHALELQLELTRQNIPFSITSGIRFFEQAHIKDVAAHLRLVCNPQDELAFKRLVRLLPGIGGRTADKLWAGYLQLVQSAPAPVHVGEAVQRCARLVPKKGLKAWAELSTLLAQLQAPDTAQQPAAMIQMVIEAGYEDHLKTHYTNYRSRLDDLEQLAGFSRQFETVEEFLSQLALLTNLELETERPAARQDADQLRLSTIHQAKGLEFTVVFVIMLCDGMFPSTRALEVSEGEEEERRLFYVAVTRARSELYLSYPLMRLSSKGDGVVMQVPSRFLGEIPEELVQEWNLRPPGLKEWQSI
jgi:DNA helicase II / ATP-dependent DNA helicase PcrA